MKAKDVTEGTRVVTDDGHVLEVIRVGRFPAIISLAGHPNRGAIDLGLENGSWSLCHPEEDLEVAA